MRARLESIGLGILCGAFYALVLLHAVAMGQGCATAKQTAVKCAANSVQIDQVFGALQDADQAKALLAVDALAFAACVTKDAVDKIIASLEPHPDSGIQAISAALDFSPVLSNARAWRAAHP